MEIILLNSAYRALNKTEFYATPSLRWRGFALQTKAGVFTLLLVCYLYSISMSSGGLPFKRSALAFSNRCCFCACFVAFSSSVIISSSICRTSQANLIRKLLSVFQFPPYALFNWFISDYFFLLWCFAFIKIKY